jgi:S-DNA-T family DNA segregation ATPase FtsK/SpoIIIE
LPPIAAPQAPEAARPYSFPVVASLAPVVGATLIWVVTSSSFALVFALLGPIVAIASVLDARIQGRRRGRRERSRFAREVTATRTAIDALHHRERTRLARASPGTGEIRDSPPQDPERWRRRASEGVPVRLGLGASPSGVRVDGLPSARPASLDPVAEEFERLRDYSATVTDVPIVVDARLGLGICGPPSLALAVARGVVIQIAHLLSPADGTIEPSSGSQFHWVRELPQFLAVDAPMAGPGVRWRSGDQGAVVAVADRAEDLPAECRVVVRVGGGRSAMIVRQPEGEVPVPIVAEFVSAEQAGELARFLAESARARGISRPESVADWAGDFSSLPVPAASPRPTPGTLACVFARSSAGPLEVDLVRHGPHAVIGGTTGSGKSELLVSWVLAMAGAHPPSTVTFLLVDFKGGSSFAPIRTLPHVVGVVTDLDERAAQRAMLSLRAELRFRERAVSAAGARTIDDPGVGLSRLVIVVDEFAAMASDFPELHELFTDLAARGRSLGLHLVLCTQRPAGAIRDAVLANATLRLSLRVNNRADSIAVLGTAGAADLPGDAPGRALLSIGGHSPILVQVAHATEADIARVVGLHPAAAGPIRRPWCDDLPAIVPLAALDVDEGLGIPIGLLDLPEQQRQRTARYDPIREGNLLAIGALRSGKSEFLRTLEGAPGVERLAGAVDAAWDGVTATIDRVRAGAPGPRLLLVDDVDALVGRFPEEYQSAFADRLVELAREGSSVGLQLVLTVRRVPPSLQTLASLCDSRLVLRLATRQDHLMAGGTVAGYVADAGPGAGEWKGARIQVALRPAALPPIGDRRPGTAPVGSVPFGSAGFRMLAVVSTRAGEFARRVRALDPAMDEPVELTGGRTPIPSTGGLTLGDARAPVIVIGDPEAWQANWALLATARSGGLVVFDRCTVADFRAISARRTLPPPIAPGVEQCWALEPDGTVRRMTAPGR